MMTREEHDDLVTDIEKHGLREPIVKYEGKILDGRNRFVAALEAEVEITEVEYDGDDALEFVMSKNKHRRHLSEPQKHDVGAEYANLRRGRPQKGKPATLPILAKAIERDRVTQAEASKVMGVSERSIRAATVVHEKAIPAIRKRYKQGHVATHIAQKIARMPSEQQEEIAELPTKDIPGAVKKVQRAVKEKELGEATRKAAKRLGSALYNVIYADPPWRFEPRSRDTGMDRAADNHYPTLSLSDIIAIKVPAADDCVLFLWATVPMLPDALQLMESWDFDYRSHQVWDKQHIGTGYWFRNRHELLLVGTRGDMPAPAPGQQYESLISIQATRHSEKPFAFREMIDELYPTASKLEMFARGGDIAGWDRWGSEATEAEEAAD
jgi:N6-adenosine-specific RNA methylase IME4